MGCGRRRAEVFSFLYTNLTKELGNYINGNCLEIYFKTVLG